MDISHELFSCFAFYSGLVLAKTLIMSFWTAKRRFAVGVSFQIFLVFFFLRNIFVQVFANPEDIKGTPNKVDFATEDVERVRRCHLVRINFTHC